MICYEARLFNKDGTQNTLLFNTVWEAYDFIRIFILSHLMEVERWTITQCSTNLFDNERNVIKEGNR